MVETSSTRPLVGSYMRAARTRSFALPVDNPVVVVAVTENQLLIVIVDASPDSGRRSEIHRRSLDRPKFARGDQSLIDRRKTVRVQREFVIQNVAIAFARQIEVTVLAEIDRRSFVGCGFVVNDQLVVVGQCISHSNLQIAGIAIVAVLAEVGESHARLAFQRLRRPTQLC